MKKDTKIGIIFTFVALATFAFIMLPVLTKNKGRISRIKIIQSENEDKKSPSQEKELDEKITWSLEDKEKTIQEIKSLKSSITLFENETAFNVRRLGEPLEINDSDSELDKMMKKNANATRNVVKHSIEEGRRIVAETKAELALAEARLGEIEKFLNSENK